jgi:hypothetical protein
MAGDRDAEVDPRFDPVFQRGYDPKVHGGRRSHSTPRHATAPTPVARPMAVVPAPVDPPAAEKDARRLERVEPVERVDPMDYVEPVASHRNPFRLALLIGSVLAIGAAALIMWRQLNDPYRYGATGTDVGAQFLQQFTDSLLVPLLTGGLIGLTLWLAIGALQRRDVIARDAKADAEG